MAASTSLYPRATVKRIVKAHSNRGISKNADIMVFLDYTLFLQQLLREAAIQAKLNGERGISPQAIRKVRETALQKFKG
ncbi:hypothetical protein BDY21DRAFT_352796 [Lineolata rhizophorae]|uniref:Transcription factor CBF/NF-Y/archaeal histone domain-containing protein n=1 Tax=Lineolata rhizophorae TaxID=578093 RepID=A0A6A6NSL0_9PEZI|nr:hypothetical protein BDY21DRAFT_352796 [Lineolata rhizophorae]